MTLESQNLSIMMTDIQGYTGTSSASSREQIVDLIRRHNRLMVPVFNHSVPLDRQRLSEIPGRLLDLVESTLSGVAPQAAALARTAEDVDNFRRNVERGFMPQVTAPIPKPCRKPKKWPRRNLGISIRK